MDFKHEPGRIYAAGSDGKMIAEITFDVHNGVANIDHTFVDSSLRGQGVAGQLVAAAVDRIRIDGLRARATCPYAAKWLEAHPDQSDPSPTAP